MSRFISSATVVFISKGPGEKRLSSATVYIGPQCGCTISHAIEYLRKNPTVKFNLIESSILSITFSYSKI